MKFTYAYQRQSSQSIEKQKGSKTNSRDLSRKIENEDNWVIMSRFWREKATAYTKFYTLPKKKLLKAYDDITELSIICNNSLIENVL